MKVARLALALAPLDGVTVTLSCGGTTEPPTVPTVASVVVTPGTATLGSLGESVQLTASARDAKTSQGGRP
jgi:hypothetical protein